MEKIIESNKEQDTYDLGYELGQHAKPGQVFTLVGDLGVGKTVFTKGLAAGLGITEPVSSPTFTIVQVYGEGVSLIEWANLIEEILPEHFTEIKIEKNLEKGFDYRRISICEF